jgi:uncharacterized protein with PIN domain
MSKQYKTHAAQKCPDCDSPMEAHKGAKIEHVMDRGSKYERVIIGHRVKWYCPKCRRIKPHSKVELELMSIFNKGAQ